ncbi:lysine N(6)-hydroxylase/L-ornithine N(5)-oxygenase family protein [Bdellovibrio bacteriovorus]|uniref:L-lysine 6-monooxygenase n=1 Tax=Bdellovibrio bacteriovorus (strain ATCC 15356 / DSM 50701 / NCIMB 9529 / HD100) TaxID=264462 RepID=Q6MMQ3_BDEBA|nr:lysine N(6)-hydroxylase/L-ornithine N(5)-oxygenase family protein [Bdellovibrio bacteriovorus]CAE79451.1 L-lysine 6-monooxygenase [Bdellovibrio bacteriovorus HD100]
MSDNKHYDLIGIGIGLFNLSLAALLSKTPDVKFRFFDRKHRFDWHSEIMFADSEMQTSYMKDLVTAADPTNPFSFMNFLVQKGLFYAFLNTGRQTITRREFEMYCQWVSQNLPEYLSFDSDIESVTYDGSKFILTINGEIFTAQNICIGTGLVPHLPEFAQALEGPEVFHAKSSYLKLLDATNKDVVVVGGGQTGLEIFRNCLQGKWGHPKSLKLIASRQNLEPLDNSPFVNEYFTPSYVKEFLQLDQDQKDPIVKYQKLASDGNTPEYLETLYRDLYQLKHVWGDKRQIEILPYRRVTEMVKIGDRYKMHIHNGFSNQSETTTADTVVLSTGFRVNIPSLIEPLRPMINFDENGRFQMNQDFQVSWNGSENNKIFALNFSRHGHGISEPQTSLMAWRSARIINNLTKKSIFPIDKAVPNFITYI